MTNNAKLHNIFGESRIRTVMIMTILSIFFVCLPPAVNAETTDPGSVPAQQQRKTVKGTVTDESGEPVIGATVMEKGTRNGTVTDFDGNQRWS